MDRWGLTLPLTGVPLPAHRDLVRSLPDLGYTDVWSAETAGTDAFTPLALVAEWSPGLRLGTAIAPIYTRGAGLLAMSAATVAELAPGRFVLGIGTSTPTIVTKWNALPFEAPYARSRDTLRFLRAALRGDKVTEKYETFEVSKFRLERPPTPPPQVVLAALRPGMLRLASREADGAITNWLAPSDVPKVRSELGTDPELVARIFVCPTTDADAARGLGRMLISSYLTVPVYAAFHEWLGRGDALRAMHEAWAAGDRQAANTAIPDEVVDELIVHGPPEKCRERVAEYVEQGLTTPVISILPTGDDPSDMVRALGRA
ncbi:LLM class F420-dependent oxidoreductase [Actinophytocola algeriensis]|uniref:Putative F420-dependent oxidoreductase n=1 Tax=Actinophytocola algeriensis TaxID=1768010 RepID=A0A7W7VH43_9PSEU|nr:LLM class F420-dependent oxidoreductase [Actinophytocola algeriensis]MBB4910021.1 putative F420-dependent oxidoreductase [Actinophytocola algeriensis]MBE1476011.1 putative F420-dependent oxidoreductase [Actinophytocola algeriensis]